ncbi:MAG: hypothetical protein PHT95_01525 [Candidatus Omnitrophica bacterium]|nr:hypothetical protein [Candidatus Omnitrophota bacterium]MDD4012950.1 hypothetical protein [Candidatus Omnitrophota bacterium]
MVKSASKRTVGKKNSMSPVLPVAIIALLIAAVVAGMAIFKKAPADTGFQKGMGYVTWSQEGYMNPEADKSLEKLKETGTDCVSILVTWYQTNCWSNDIQPTEKTPTDESLVYAIRKCHEMGFKVMLKPHLDLLDTQDGSWRGEIGCLKEEDWDKWFDAYTKYIMHYVNMAVKEKVEMFCVGTELSTTATVKGYMWSDLIKKVRQKYNGLLTYAAHWDRYQDIRFWDQLDYVGINAYFPLTEDLSPSYQEMKDGWKKWLVEIEEFQERANMPIIFPECGCNSADGAAIRPWEHVARREANVELQADYYKALLETFWDKEWFHGLYWWYWGTVPGMGGKYNRGFTPQNKPAEDILKEWYAKPVRRTGKSGK